MELISNLEAKHLKVSEYNKQLLQEVLANTGGGLDQTMGTVKLLKTLNQIIVDEESEIETIMREELLEKDTKIKELEMEIERKKEEINQNKKFHEFQLKEIQLELDYLKKTNNRLQESLDKAQAIKYQEAIKQLKIENLKSKNFNFEPYLLNLDYSSQSILKSLIADLRSYQPKENTLIQNNQTLELFKSQLQRSNSSCDLSSHPLEEPTPRFEPSYIPQAAQNLNITSNSVFGTNLSLNRTLLQHTSKLTFTSTLHTLFKRRPQKSDAHTDLWAYIHDLETELIDMQMQQKRQQDESQLEISVCMGQQEANKEAKESLEEQIEEMENENMRMTRRIAELERFNRRVAEVMREAEKEEEHSYLENLRGILSPKQYKKICKFVKEECQEGGVVNELTTIDDQNISMIEAPNNVSYLIDNDQSYFMKEARIINQESKDSTMSFRQQLNLDNQSDDPNSSKYIISQAYYQSNNTRGFNQKQSFKRMKPAKNMLIQDQMNTSGYDLPYMQNTGDDQFFSNQPSMIYDAYSSTGYDQSQFVNTQNKTLQNLLRMKPQNINSQSSNQNGGFKRQGILGFKRKQQLNQSRSTFNNRSFQGGQTGHIIQQMHDNFQSQLLELKDEKLKLIQILNKFLNLNTSADASSQNLEDLLNTTDPLLPSKSYFEDFRLQITQALTQQQLDLQSYQSAQTQLQQDLQDLSQQKQKLEQKRLAFNSKVLRLKDKQLDLSHKLSLLDERERLLDQQEQKLKYRKSAMDEEWKRLDKKREDLSQQETAVSREWEKLGAEMREIEKMRKEAKQKRMEAKETKAKVETERRRVEQEWQRIGEERTRIEESEREVRGRERAAEREMQRVNRIKEEMQEERIEIEKQKEFIKGERSLIEQERQQLEQKRSLSGMYIPDLKQLVGKMTAKHKSLNRTYINEGQESRIRQQTNMSAYIRKCQCTNDSSGIFNCELHKTMNKSTISLSNVSQYHSQKYVPAIGSGRPTYKPLPSNSKLAISKSFLRDNSFKRIEQTLTQKNLNNSTLSFMFPRNDSSNNSEEKENHNRLNSGLESILKGTAKFKQTQEKLEQTYNSLMESICEARDGANGLNDTQYSFASFEGDLAEAAGHSLSKDEL